MKCNFFEGIGGRVFFCRYHRSVVVVVVVVVVFVSVLLYVYRNHQGRDGVPPPLSHSS